MDPILISGCINAIGAVIASQRFSTCSNAGPFEHSGKLYVVGYETLGDRGDASAIGVWRSSDDGATWARVGGTKGIAAADVDGGNADVRPFDVCRGNADNLNKLFAAYVNTAGKLAVSRFDLDFEDWDATAVGADVETTNNAFGVYLAQCDDSDDVWVIANDDYDETYRVRKHRLPGPFNTVAWDSPITLEAPWGGDMGAQSVLGLVAGHGGRVHAFYQIDLDLKHCDIANGNTGTTIYTAPEGFSVNNLVAATRTIPGDLEVVAVFAIYIDSGFDVYYRTATSSGGSFSGGTIETGGTASIRVCSADDKVALLRRKDYDNIAVSFWDDAGWSDDVLTELFSGNPSGCGFAETGLGGTFDGNDVGVGSETRFLWVPTESGSEQQIIGGAGIPSAEAFGVSSGVSGGGTRSCDPVDPDNPPGDPTCGPGGEPVDPDNRSRCGMGLAI